MPILTPEERIGTTLGGKYRIERILAGGGMGTVFAGVHEWTHRPVAVKVLNYEHARDPEIVRRFLQEARAAAQLKHPNVVDVLDMGQEADGSVYLVLELLEGETLKARVKRGPLELGEAAEMLGPIMRALASAHKKGVVHRDLKPDNIFLTYDESGQLVPKLLDFGIAKVGTGDSSSTRTGTMVGTPHFMAPEQVRGERDVGPAADVWSMGVVLYACLSGRLPFEAESTAGVLAKVITERPVPLLAVAPQLPPEVGELVDRAMQPRPGDRWRDMGEMLAALFRAITPYTSTLGSPALASLASPTPTPSLQVPDLEGTPTVQLDVGALPTPAPSAWSGEPPVANPRSSSAALKLALPIAMIAILAVGAGAVWRMTSAPAEPAAPASDRPLFDVTQPRAAQPPPAPEPPHEIAAEDVAPELEVAPVEAVEPDPLADVAAPAQDVAATEEQTAAEESAPPLETSAARETERPAPDAHASARTSDPERSTRRPRREPVRGTGGALILR